MSRTNHSSKGPGYEYWTKRASSTKTRFWSIGQWNKKLTRRILRRRWRVKKLDDRNDF